LHEAKSMSRSLRASARKDLSRHPRRRRLRNRYVRDSVAVTWQRTSPEGRIRPRRLPVLRVACQPASGGAGSESRAHFREFKKAVPLLMIMTRQRSNKSSKPSRPIATDGMTES
jgi:hypothetical protein